METVSIEVHNSLSQIKGNLSKICVDQIKFGTSYAIPGAHFSAAYRRGFWDGRTQLFETKTQTVPTGLLSRVRAILTQNGIPYLIKDLRIKPQPTLEINPTFKFPHRPYQQETVDKAPLKQRGIIRIATGGGKAQCIAGIVGSLKVPSLILVHKRDLFWQLVETLETSLHVPIGKIGAGIVDPKDVTVAMVQTVARLFNPKLKKDRDEDDDLDIEDPEALMEFIRSRDCVLVDECHRINGGQYEAALRNCNAFYRFGLSATPFRTDQADILLDAYTGPRFIDVTASYLIEQGYLAAPTIYLVPFKHKKQPSELSYAELYTATVVENAGRNDLIVDLVRKAVDSGKTVLVAITRVEHGHILEKLLQAVESTTIFAHGKVDSKDRQKILKELDQKVRKVVISTTVFGEGVDVPSLSVIINAKAAESPVDSMQLAGRALRITPTKKTATVIDVVDTGCRFLSKHADSRAETYRGEPKYNVKEVRDISEVVFQ